MCLPGDSHQWLQGIEITRRQLVIPEGSDRTGNAWGVKAGLQRLGLW
jgi:hypothetical protein